MVRGLGDTGREMMQTLGIKEGDIVVAVNGENLSKSIQAVNNLSKLKDASKVNVEIDRGGTRLFFDFEFDQAGDDTTSDAQGANTKPVSNQALLNLPGNTMKQLKYLAFASLIAPFIIGCSDEQKNSQDIQNRESDPAALQLQAETGLPIAIKTANIADLKRFIENGIAFDSPAFAGKTPLMLAAQTGNTEVITYLLNAGAGVNALTKKMDQR